jgi:Flp pilus assembly protein CpaB
VPLHGGHLLAASDLAARTGAIPPGRTRLAVAWDPPAGAAGDINPGDTVVVYSTPRQGVAMAEVLIPQATVVRVVRPQAVASGSFSASGADARATSVVLDLDVDQAARLAAASHMGTLDIAPVGADQDTP